eukprot:420376-Rhodomonas_salina.2
MAVARNREGSRGSSALLRGAREHISSAHHVLLEVKLGRSEQISLCGTEERRKRRGGSRKRRIVGKGVGDVRTSILTPFDGGEIKVNKVLSSTTTTVSLPMSTLFVLISRSAERRDVSSTRPEAVVTTVLYCAYEYRRKCVLGVYNVGHFRYEFRFRFASFVFGREFTPERCDFGCTLLSSSTRPYYSKQSFYNAVPDPLRKYRPRIATVPGYLVADTLRSGGSRFEAPVATPFVLEQDAPSSASNAATTNSTTCDMRRITVVIVMMLLMGLVLPW